MILIDKVKTQYYKIVFKIVCWQLYRTMDKNNNPNIIQRISEFTRKLK